MYAAKDAREIISILRDLGNQQRALSNVKFFKIIIVYFYKADKYYVVEYERAASKLKHINCYKMTPTKFILAKKNIARDYVKVSVDSTKGNL